MNRKNVIKNTWTVVGMLVDCVVVLLIVVGFSFFVSTIISSQLLANDPTQSYMIFDILPFATIASVVIVSVGALTYVMIMNRRQKHRDEALLLYSAKNNFTYLPNGVAGKEYGLMSLHYLAEKTRHYLNCISTKDWQYCDFLIDIYGHSKGGDYHKYTQHYAVITTQLPRMLPNVLFDSHINRKRQFKFEYVKAQRHSLEGNFDQYFDTYFPTEYKIDSLSFISPDVMHALIDAHEYDIEIVGDRLYLYGTPYEPTIQLPEMQAKLQAIKKQLLDNIVTYRDERLPYAVGRQRVGAEGMQLKRSKLISQLTGAAVIIYVLIRVIINVLSN